MSRAWKLIQTHLGLTPDGIPGELTASAIIKALKLEPSPSTAPTQFSARTNKTLSTLLPAIRPDFITLLTSATKIASRHGLTVEAISGTRTYAEQDHLYAQGRTRPGSIVTNAKAGQSNHNFGVAIDLGLFRGSSYIDSTEPELASKVYAEIAANAPAKLAWGGYWKIRDTPHFEYKHGLTMSQLRERVAKNIPII